MDFIDALVVFIREKRKAEARQTRSEPGLDSLEKDADAWERDPSWARDYPVGIHKSLEYRRRAGKDATNLNLLEAERVRCAYRGKGSKHW